MIEVWKDIPGYEGRYQISDAGLARSLDRHEPYGRWGDAGLRFVKGRLRKLSWGGPPKSKYLGFFVKHTDGSPHFLKVHVCVLKAFVGERPSSNHDACHRDGDRSNNALLNLRWDTKSSNNQDKKVHGTWQGGVKNSSAKLTEADVILIRSEACHRTLKSIADEFGVSIATIHSIKLRKTWSHLT